jgi:hypothetical protein
MKSLILSLVESNPQQRPEAKKLFTKFQDQLYQDMIISNTDEYKKIISFLFSEKNKFPSNAEFAFEQKEYEIKL